jgi:tripartite ATP-independent transporter DctM subunit
MLWILVLSFIILLFIGVPIIFCLGLSSMFYLFFSPVPLVILPQKMLIALENFLLVSLPLFILVGEIMNKGGVTTRLINLSKILVGKYKGGLAYVNILVSMFFGGVQGMATADTAAIGSVLIPAMIKEGYEPDFSVAVTVSSSTIGPIIPPSFLFLIYSMVAEVSVGAMFLGGILPGILLAIAQMGLVFLLAKNRIKFPKGEKLSHEKTIKYLLESLPVLVLPIIIVVGIVSGICTATEAAAIAVVYALIISLFIGELKVKDIPNILFRAAKLSGSICLIISTAGIFAWILTIERVPYKLAEFLTLFSDNKIILLFLLNIILLFIGTFMDPTVAVLIVTPVILPILTNIGMNPIHIGVFICFNLIIGLTTPPVGQCLFIASNISKLSIERITKAIIPFIIINICVLFLITYFPIIVMILPKLIMGM